MNNFYCGLHLLVNFAEVSDGVIKTFEANLKGNEHFGAEAHPETSPFTKKDESGAVRLVRTASKCLSRGGDDKNGCYLDFKTYLIDKYGKQSKQVSNLLVPFRGNRFNILFYNSEIVFFLSEDILDFFKHVNKPSNRLQKAVAYDIQVQTYISIVKALGLCSKLVTAPFWRAIENKNCSLEDATVVYQRLYNFISKAKDDCTDVICGSCTPLPDLVRKDVVYERLTTTDIFDAQTCVVLQQIFSVWYTLLTKAAGDYLSGGRFAEFDKPLALETQSAPTHNKFPERVFALLDALTRYRPNASTLCNECYIMFSLNKTGEWINTLDNIEKEKILDKARQEGREIRQKYLNNIKAIETERQQRLKRKRQEIEKKEEEAFRKREELVDDMLYFGLWQYPEVVDQRLKTMKNESEKRKALKTQLMFRKKILEQKADKLLFQLSEKGKLYSIEKLSENVKTLIKLALRGTNQSMKENIFVGKRIVHYQLSSGVRTPYYGRVISSVPRYPDWCNVIYDNDEAVYAYKLSEDYAAGDLDIVVGELFEKTGKEGKAGAASSC